ncbi:hypothetical protein [Paenibacillus roseipurpureus]|uniref:Uncharacterized protein n=1 Tax=Paenibacillus roseopurpureus TaxID=2918901 RepID=A0AA96LKU9_9BACL|nr:hypothetical protein [Paenibacillus sp. MBLB1832]WNR42957.1 hypothetical protein MJB10_17770 [Paenibacillus sp. MBLB1832]
MDRQMYISYLKNALDENSQLKLIHGIKKASNQWFGEGLLSFSLFLRDRVLCVYVEMVVHNPAFDWAIVVNTDVEPWPYLKGPRYSALMPDIFHDGVPVDPDSWRSGRTIERRSGSLARLKPDMVASYVFYHYQAQEEKPEHFNKTYVIGLHGTWIFSYGESPAVVSENKPLGKLATRQTPDNWHEVMDPHFDKWPNDVIWSPMQHLITLER